MAQIIPLTQPELIRTWLVQDLFSRAFGEGTFMPGGFAGNEERFVELASDPHYIFLLGIEDTKLRAVAVLLLPDEGDFIPAQVLHFYSEGSVKLRGQLVDAVVETLRARGHVRFWAINQSKVPDSVWVRTFRRAGDWKRIGSVMEVETKGAPTE